MLKAQTNFAQLYTYYIGEVHNGENLTFDLREKRINLDNMKKEHSSSSF